MSSPEFEHKSVLLGETIDSLRIDPNGGGRTFIDCTGGRGGHSAEILSRLSKSDRLIVLDQDPDAIKVLSGRFSSDERVSVVRTNFSRIKEVCESLGVGEADGIIADLGVSSYQIDNAERGFSYMQDAPLDMRMSKEGLSAADIVNTYSQRELADVIYRYGEEKFSRQIAAAIVSSREVKRIETTLELSEIIKGAIPISARRKSKHHVAKKTFQALRIEANDELNVLKSALDDMFELLSVGGVLSVITFHSLEDRIVKQSFAARTVGCTCPKEFPVCVCGKTPEGKTSKFVRPSEKELEENPRSRSATLRSITKIR